jgi:hypothetical protein
VNDASLSVTPDGHAPYRIALDPRTLSAPVVDRTRFSASTDGAYTIALNGRFGFDAVTQPAQTAMRLAFPSDAPWTLAAVPHHPPVAGEALDVVAASASAACLSHAEMQIGSAPPVTLTATQLDSRRVELRASLAGIPPGPAQIRLYEDDPSAGHAFETASALTIAGAPAQVDVKSAVVSLGDAFVSLVGSGFERIRGVLVNGVTYTKEPGATATSACFDGPPLAGAGLAVGQHVTAQLESAQGDAGQVFPLTIAPPRPPLASALVAGSTATSYLATTPLIVALTGGSGELPRQAAVRVRQADGTSTTPCDSSRPDPTAVTLPAANVHVRSANTLAVDFRADVLHDLGFGTLQMQLIDAASGIGGNWVSLPGTFVRAPAVTQIACPSDGNAMCRLYGTDLAAVDAVKDASGDFVAPGLDCPPTDKGVTCIFVPHLAHYTLRLIDAATIETLPDGLIAKVAS